MNHWTKDAIFYHIYPLGLTGAPERNDFQSPPAQRLEALTPWLDHIKGLGANALYLGPVFESTAHGYDTKDYFQVDRRLGDNESLKRFCLEAQVRGIKVVLDAVFNHVGRDFYAFQDLIHRRGNSPYKDWFVGVDFSKTSPYGDPFSYEGWNGHYNLVKLNLAHAPVREHLFAAVRFWKEEFGIHGLRLDAADCLDFAFMEALSSSCYDMDPDFWLLGEVIHGDYRQWVQPGRLHSVTNYEVFKGLWSSHNDANYHEIAYSLNRQFAEGGLYQNFRLYNFLDNHDVDRIASQLTEPAHIYPAAILLYTIPGIPSVYYGSEGHQKGRKTQHSDAPLRPTLSADWPREKAEPDLLRHFQRLSQIRQSQPALWDGDYLPLLVQSQQMAFSRRRASHQTVVALNAGAAAAEVTLEIPGESNSLWKDVLNPGREYKTEGSRLVMKLDACWGAILERVT